MTVRRWRRLGAGALAAWVACLAPTIVDPPAAEATTAGGRVVLGVPIRALDTGAIAPVSQLALPSRSVLTVTVAAGPVRGEAVVHACGQPPPQSPALAVFAAGDTVVNTVVTGPADCLTTTAPAHVTVDQRGAVAAAPSAAGSQYVQLATVVDASPAEVVSGASTIALPGLAPDATGTVLGVSVAAIDRPGEVTFYPCGSERPATADLLAGSAPSGAFVVTPLSAEGVASSAQCLYASAPAIVQVTVLGYLQRSGPDATAVPPTLRWKFGDVAPPGFEPVTPTRVVDTRIDAGARHGKVAAGGVLVVDLAANVTLRSTAAVLNVTATEPEAAGFLTVYPCDAGRPLASNLNYAGGQTVANLVTAKLAYDATVCVFSQAAAHVVVDLTGTFELGRGLGFAPIAPDRLLDTRQPTLGLLGKLPAGRVLTLPVAGFAGVPSVVAGAVTLNITVTEPDASGYLTVYPCDAERPTASNLNYVAGQTVPNAVTIGLSAAGTVCIYSQRATHVVVDVDGWYGPFEAAGFEELAPVRALDTRLGPAGGRSPDGRPIFGALSAGGPLAAGQPAGLTLRALGSGAAALPDDARAAVLNVTITDPTGDGFLSAYPCGVPSDASSLNFARGQTVANQVTVALSSARPLPDICFVSNQTTQVVVDIAGYFTDVPERGWVPDVP